MAEKSEIKFEQPSASLLLANKNLWLVLLLIVLTTLSFGYFFLLRPRISAITEASQGVEEVQAKEAEVKALIQKVTDLEYQFNSVKTQRNNDLRRLEKIIPQNPEIAELFVLAERLAINRGLILQGVDFSQEEVALAKTDSAEAEGTLESGSSLNSISINMSVAQDSELIDTSNKNPYDLFKEYLNDLESNLRLMDVESVNFSGVEGGESSLTMDFTIKTYFVAK
ncbi:hypothetical protein H6761_02490 [Candidatus Nomurabacteria bacterium]|nr:hypothetical protein [Candidatus Nomurabacteria bacterium]